MELWEPPQPLRPALFDRAQEKANAEGRTVSEVAREALQTYLAS